MEQITHSKLEIEIGRKALSAIALCALAAVSASALGPKGWKAPHASHGYNPSFSAQMAAVTPIQSAQIKQLVASVDSSQHQPPADLSAFVTAFSHGQLKMISSAPGPFGLTAVNLLPINSPGAQNIIAWVLPQEAGIILGPLFDEDGDNKNLDAEAALHVKPPNTIDGVGTRKPVSMLTPDQVKAAMSSAGFSGFTEGNGPNKISVFIDANCSICHDLWEKLQADSGWQKKFTITWIPVGAFKATSEAMGAAILAGGNKALDYNEIHFDTAAENGGIKGSNDQALIDKIRSNTAAWVSLVKKTGQEPGTPTIVVNAKQVLVGLPPAEEMSRITGVNFP